MTIWPVLSSTFPPSCCPHSLYNSSEQVCATSRNCHSGLGVLLEHEEGV